MIYHILDAFRLKFSSKGYFGILLVASSTFIEKFSVVIALLTALLGLILVAYNIAIKMKEYHIKKIELENLKKNG